MAIKPNDCIIKLKDLEIGYDIIKDWDGRTKQIPIYKPYWANFLQYVKDTTDWKSEWDAYNRNFERQLSKFNAIYKETKNYEDRYIKFNKHSDFTFFILRWQ